MLSHLTTGIPGERHVYVACCKCAPPSVCRRCSLRPEEREREDARESTDAANLGMLKMRWKMFLCPVEWGECCDAFVDVVAV